MISLLHFRRRGVVAALRAINEATMLHALKAADRRGLSATRARLVWIARRLGENERLGDSARTSEQCRAYPHCNCAQVDKSRMQRQWQADFMAISYSRRHTKIEAALEIQEDVAGALDAYLRLT